MDLFIVCSKKFLYKQIKMLLFVKKSKDEIVLLKLTMHIIITDVCVCVRKLKQTKIICARLLHCK